MAETLFDMSDMESIIKGLEKFGEKFETALQMYLTTHAARLEAQMKSKRPWVDRTGSAKQTLTARVSKPDENIYRITCAHGVDYGIWLELAHEKNYAIVAPTITNESPKIISGLTNLI